MRLDFRLIERTIVDVLLQIPCPGTPKWYKSVDGMIIEGFFSDTSGVDLTVLVMNMKCPHGLVCLNTRPLAGSAVLEEQVWGMQVEISC